jgi:TolB-like protein
MPSLIPGYEYDIFVSYRHKDNKYDGWVTEFVNNLKKEIEATFKEDISIYFDENPHDGLLETHDVDESLKDKLKCLIFIPIISQTYCDPKSFAWKNEFLVFKKLADADEYGLKVKLPNGNIAGRILPVKIHELDPDDKVLLEDQIGPIRSVDFIFRTHGVNRPMRVNEDHPSNNLNKTFYRDQLNKTANSLKEVIMAIFSPTKRIEQLVYVAEPPVRELPQKSVVVLPFVNISNDPEQEFFSDGLTEELIADLSGVHDLIVISRSSAMTFKGSQKKLSEIARELNVKFVLEGSVRKHNNTLRITAQLIDAETDSHLWAEKFNESLSNIFDIQERISRTIVDKLKVRLTPAEDDRIGKHAFDNVQAYESYLHAKRELLKWNKEAIDEAHRQIQNGLSIIGPNATLYGTLAYVYWSYSNLGHNADQNWKRAEEYVQKTLELDPLSADAHLVIGLLFQTIKGDQQQAIRSFKEVLKVRPNDFDALTWLSVGYCVTGYPEHARLLANRMIKVDPLSSISHAIRGVIDFYSGHFKESIPHIENAYSIEPSNPFWQYFKPMTLVYSGMYEEAIEFIHSNILVDSKEMIVQTALMFQPALKKDKEQILMFLETEVIQMARNDAQYSHFLAALCALAGLTDQALDWLENAVRLGFVNYPLLAEFDPTLESLRPDKRFRDLLMVVNKKWKAIEV